jgi:serine protease Do
MRLRRRLLLALGAVPLCWGPWTIALAQEGGTPSTLVATEGRAQEPPLLNHLGARRTPIVAAIERVKGAVVNIHSERTVAQNPADLYAAPAPPNRVNGMGTGILIDPRGYIVTNQHVVDDVSVLRIRLADGTTAHAAVVARNSEMDLALLKIEVGRPLPVMPLGTATDLLVGESVIAIGNAYGYEHTASDGIVSALKRDVSLNKDMAYKGLIQTTAPINPGNSGGPLINVNGELVGVNVAIRAGAQNIGFAIPVDHMVRAVADMLRSRRRAGTYDGLIYRDALEVGEDGLVRKVVIDRVEAGSPAENAGMRQGDVLLQMGDVKIKSSIDVERCLLERKTGDSFAVTVRRQEQERNLELALNAAERGIRPAADNMDAVWARLGLRLVPVPADQVARVNSQLRGGLEVLAVSAQSAAARAGIQKGDILVGLHQWETVSLGNVTYVLNHPELPTFSPLLCYILRSGQVHRKELRTP